LHQELREENEDEIEEEEEMVEHDYSHTASPLYHELMGMMQGQAAAANGVGSPGPGSPASPGFQLETGSSSSHGTTSRDSQLTIRFNPRRDSSRDSNASASTLTHATIVRGASIVRRVRADVVTTPPAFSTVKGKGRGRERSPVHLVEIVQDEDDIDDDNDDDEGDSSSDAASSDEDGTSGSPVGTLALTSAPNSQEDSGGCKSLRNVYGHVSPLPSPSPSPLRASFLEPVSEEHAHAEAQAQKETQKASIPMQGPYVTPPPSAPPMPVRRPPPPVPPIDGEGLNGVPTPSPSSWGPTEETNQVENDILPPTYTSTGAAAPRYPAWLAAVVLPLAEFVDDSADPRALFTDLQEIAQGESGSVYSARAAPAVAPQFRPPMPRSPASGRSSPSSTSEKEMEEEDYGAQQKQKHELVAIKRVPLLPGGTEKLIDLRRELEFARALRHANVLRMERLYVDVVEESLWIGMELLDRSLADVLAVVGEDAGAGGLSGSDRANSEVQEGAVTGVVEIPERMVARFVSDVSDTLSNSSQFSLSFCC
jgi:p21-activated kinase 1